MRGIQLWNKLPARKKMKAAAYRDIEPAEIPEVRLPQGGRVKVIAGKITLDGHESAGPIEGGSTDPFYLDVDLPAGARFVQRIPAGYNALLYPFEGSVAVGPAGAGRALDTHRVGVLSDGDDVEVSGGPAGGRFILVAGRPLKEPVVQYGPFVMNTREEIEQAIRDYQNGELTGGKETARPHAVSSGVR
jgi:redox-sensitive bicupin YhaK (pirin superfamily)